MVAHTKTISNSVNALGMGPATRYSAASYGSGIYGEGSNDMIQKIGKVIGNSVTPSDAISKKPTKQLVITLVASMDMTEEKLGDGSGYYYIFKRPSCDAEDRTLADWALTSSPVNSFACVAGASTTWS